MPSLDALIHPLGVEEFLSGCWGRRARYLPGTPERFAELAVDRQVFAAAATSSFLRSGTAHLKAQYFDGEGRHREIAVPAVQIDPLYAAGMTLCLSRIDDDVRPAALLAEQVKEALGLAGPVSCNAYLSPPGRGFGLHYDSQSVFILQIEGAKAWRYSETPAREAPVENLVAEPPSFDQFHADNPTEQLAMPDPASLVQHRLGPGDVLYLPPGCWHQTMADGPSLSLSLTCATRNFTDLITSRLARVFRSRPDWRRDLPAVRPADVPAGALPDHVERFFAERLAELRAAVDAMDPRQLANQWLGYLASPRRGPPIAPDHAPIGPVDRFRVRRPLRFAIDTQGDAEMLFIRAPGLDVVLLPPDTLPFVRELAARDVFTAEDATGWAGGDEVFSWDDVHDALEALLSVGLITREPAAP